MALTYTPHAQLGSSLPNFKLKGTDEKVHSSDQVKLGSPVLVMFICNHCPYVQAIESRLIDLAARYKNQVQIFAICSNDGDEYPEDSFPEMKKRAQEKGYPFAYLHDETQQVAKTFGAVCTPDFFVFDKQHRLAYRGRFDDSWKDANKVQQKELESALILLLNDKDTSQLEQNPSMGCSIKWK